MTEGDDESAPPLVLKKPLTEEERKVDTTLSLCKYFQQLVCFFVLKDQELQIDRFEILKSLLLPQILLKTISLTEKRYEILSLHPLWSEASRVNVQIIQYPTNNFNLVQYVSFSVIKCLYQERLEKMEELRKKKRAEREERERQEVKQSLSNKQISCSKTQFICSHKLELYISIDFY